MTETDQLKTRVTELESALQSIIDGACHPEKAMRRVMVDLAPIRKVLKKREENK